MSIFFSVLFLLQGFIDADAAPDLLSITFPRQTSVGPSLPSECACPDSRSRWDILWSCLVTIFACSWVSVHPNIPGPSKHWWTKGLSRLELMFWSIISPELIIFWASRQWLAARHLAKIYRNYGWTMAHGYYIQMGGFMLYDGDQVVGVLSPEKLDELLEKRLIEMPKLKEEDLKDRCKGDGLSKAVVIVQTTWFIAQCIARRAGGLIITELELVTLAFAALNLVMYVFWWSKPLDVQTTVPVYLLRATPPQSPIRLSPVDERPVQDEDIHYENNSRTKTSETSDIQGTDIDGESHVFPFLPHGHQAIKNTTFWDFTLQAWRFFSNIFFRWPVAAAIAVVSRVHDIFTRNESIGEGKKSVNTFYAYDNPSIGTPDVILVYALPFVAIIFGAIHCAGWNFYFPSRIESYIWRVSSAVITGIPTFAMVAIFLTQQLEHCDDESVLVRAFVAVVVHPLHAMLPVYVLARLALLVEALISLRDLPSGALAVVQWTSFIPHV